MKDWRADISDLDSLDEVDPRDMMIYLRHSFLEAAKDLTKSRHAEDREFGFQCLSTAENIQSAIDSFLGE